MREIASTIVAVVVIPILVFGSRGSPAHGHRSGQRKSHPKLGPTAAFLRPLAPGSQSYLAPGSDPNVLPGPILIADKLNNRLIIVDPEGHIRWVWPQAGDLAPGQSFLIPDDAFFSPDGRYIIATEEDDFVITVIDIATGKIVWRYGHPGISGSASGYLWNPPCRYICRIARDENW